ncbi:MAG TPA: ABC transporter ATP-binding protein [Candidatus Brocadiia bacterium]|nr:ABC transporter ATP-binding protein [Candidatus Brocadiia bacterium]
MTEPIIQVEDFTARYGEALILDHINFQVRRGEIFVVLGGSGCGKSTLLKHMIGLYKPAGGRILINGQDLAKADGAERIQILRTFGVLFQGSGLFGSMSVGENVALPLKEHTTLPPEIIALIVRMKLQMVGLNGFEHHLPSEISGGMKKRAGLARAMALDPDILFFDEPSAGLDPVTSAGLDQLLLKLRASLGTTMVVVTHELPSIYTIADRVIMLDSRKKKIAAEGKPLELRDTHEDPWVRDFFRRQAGPAGGHV